MPKYRCVHCGDEFESDKRLAEKNRFCPYCYSVASPYAKPDSRWLPSLDKGEKLGKGFHEV